MMQIDTDILEKIIKIFFEKIKAKNIKQLRFENDFYWTVPVEAFTDLNHTPELHVGSLKDDIEFLKSLIEEDYDANFLELERLSAIFKTLALEIDQITPA